MQSQKILLYGSLYTLGMVILVAADVHFTSSATLIPKYAQEQASIPGAVKPKEAPNVQDVLKSLGMTTEQTDEKGLLSRVVPEEIPVDRKALLQNGDRLAFFATVQSPDVSTYFSSLKEALQKSFSPQMHDLIDTTQSPEGHPVRNMLSFVDPTLSEEKMIFVRSRDRLYEIHVANGKDEGVAKLVDALTE